MAHATAPAPDEPMLADQRVAFVAGTMLAVLDLSDTVVFPYLADFFLNHEVAQSTVGLMFSLLTLGIMVTAPFMGSIMSRVGGPARAMVLGTLAFAAQRILTACLPLLPDGTPMVYGASAVFLLNGVIYAFSEIGSLTWVLLMAPSGQKVAAMGTMIASRGIGTALGQPVGGVLFDLIGWVPTNVVCAIGLCIPLFVFRDDLLASPAVTPDDESRASKVQHKNALYDVRYVLANLFNVAGQTAMYSWVPYLQPYYASEYGAPKWMYGLIAMVCVIIGYMGMATTVDSLDAALGGARKWKTLSLGTGATLVGFFLLGPTPLIPFLSAGGIYVSGVGWMIVSMGIAVFQVTGPAVTVEAAVEYGIDEEEATVQAASLTISVMAVGLAVGPVIGGFLAENYGVPWANTILGLGLAAVAVLAQFLLWLVDFSFPRAPRNTNRELM